MADWRENRGYNYNQTSIRSYRAKPPIGNQPTVPNWEKKFCAKSGMPWGRLLDAQDGMSYYKGVMEWNDLEAEEAFYKAKSRYWAEINRLGSDISLPDPDIYIDNVDWNAKVDPELVLELDKVEEYVDSQERTYDNVVILPIELRSVDYQLKNPSGWGDDEKVIPTGWGDIEEKVIPTGWGEIEDNTNFEKKPIEAANMSFERNANENPWEVGNTGWNAGMGVKNWDHSAEKSWNCSKDNPREGLYVDGSAAVETDAWGYSGDKSCWNKDNPSKGISVEGIAAVDGWGHSGNKSWDTNRSNTNDFRSSNWNSVGNSGGWGSWNENHRKRENSGQYMSRYKTSRFQGDEYHNNMNWNDYRGRKRVSFAYGQKNKPSPNPKQWNCGPISHQKPGEVRNSWV
ncbi:hypothetical protein GIB67_016586 [Kingdonia uniflora]|uniref:Uncharacterized protein n=1 Tax=Kingdonia uniflora TaxID=39325 RepID=A0A7J7MZE8_9MAGN|nr:hypothetical protein GIB67_016586 [Kingdonia uniflora]